MKVKQVFSGNNSHYFYIVVAILAHSVNHGDYSSGYSWHITLTLTCSHEYFKCNQKTPPPQHLSEDFSFVDVPLPPPLPPPPPHVLSQESSQESSRWQ